MEDSAYLESVLRERACPLCRADRRKIERPWASDCGVCRNPIGTDDVVLAVGTRAAVAVCSLPCLEVVLQEGLVAGPACPLCGAPWSQAGPDSRECGTCAAPLVLEEGYAGLWRGRRIQTFCGAACLGLYLKRANPFCG